MKKLTTQEISFIHTCLKSAMKTDWIDARYETVDHIASSIEETWVQQPQVPFREAYNAAIQKLNNGLEIEKMIKSRKRAVLKSFFYSYGSFLIDPKRWLILTATVLISLGLSYYLLSSASNFPSRYSIWTPLIFLVFFSMLDYCQMALTGYSNTKSIKYQIYRYFMSIEIFGPYLALSFLIGDYTAPTILEMVLTCLTVYLTISFLTFKYFIYRSTMVQEFETYRNLEINRTLSDA